MEKLIWKLGPLLPLGMVVLNVLNVVSTFLNEGRIKVNCAQYAVRYAVTVPAAMRGDLSQFMVVLAS
jgi:hypothetical protein